MSTKPGGEELLTTLDVAKDLGVDKSTVCRIAQEFAIGSFVGTQRVFTRKDATEVRKRCHFRKGNPNFSKKTD